MHHRDFASEKWSHKVRCIWVRWCVTWGIDWKENPENVKLCFKGLAKNGKYQTSQCVILLTQSFIKVLSLIKYSSGSVTFHLILFFLSNLRSFLTQILFFVVFSLVTRRPPSVTRKALLWQSCPQSGREKGMVSDSLWKISLFSCLFFFFFAVMTIQTTSPLDSKSIMFTQRQRWRFEAKSGSQWSCKLGLL